MAIKHNSSILTTTQNNLKCYHCGSVCDERNQIQEEISGQLHKFCCVGCLSIAKMIHDQGLEVFYARRDSADFSSNRPVIPPFNVAYFLLLL